MGSKIYVGGLPYLATESHLNSLFTIHGTPKSVRIIKDRFTGQSRRFGFVEMSTGAEAMAAIASLNGTRLAGRMLTVKKTRSTRGHTQPQKCE